MEYFLQGKTNFRWFKKWGIKMDSQLKQRAQQKADIGSNLVAEFLPLERQTRKGNKTVTVMKQTACAYVDNLTGKILDYVEQNSRYHNLFENSFYCFKVVTYTF